MLLTATQHKKSFTNAFVAMAVADRPASSQALWHFIAIVRDCNWHDWYNCECFGAFTIIEGHGPVTYCGEGLGVALHNVRSLNAAYCCLAQHTWSLALVARGLSSSCMMYTANCPCGKGLIVIPSPVAILGKGFIVAFFGRRLIVALLNRCVLLGILAVLTLGAVNAVFGVLTVLNLATYTPSWTYLHVVLRILTVPNLSIFALLFFAWHGMFVVASCKQQHIIFDCCMGVALDHPLHSSVIVSAHCNGTIKNEWCVLVIVAVASQTILLLALHAFAIIDVVDPHWWKGLVTTCAFCCTCCNQPSSLLPATQQKNIIVFVALWDTALRIDHYTSTMLLLWCISLQALCAFTIVVCSFAMRH